MPASFSHTRPRPSPHALRPRATRGRHRTCCRASVLRPPLCPAVGIDLGTTNSAVAVIEAHGAAATVADPDSPTGAFTVPSVVAFGPGAAVTVGRAALAAAAAAGAGDGGGGSVNRLSSVKRVMGRSAAQAADLGALLGAPVVPGPRGEALLECPQLGRALPPEEVLSHLLRKLILMAADHLGCQGADITQAVVTVPAQCSAEQRAATLRAGRLAGLTSVCLLQEPVAAALAFGFGAPDTAADTLAVFDFGGGTFDVSIVDSFEGIMEVLSTAGDSRLGGDDLDAALADALAASLPAGDPSPPAPAAPSSSQSAAPGRGTDAEGGSGGEPPAPPPPAAALLRRGPAAAAALVAAARAAKEALSTYQEVGVKLPPPWAGGGGGGGGGEVRISRGAMEEAVAGVVRRLWPPIEAAAREARVALAAPRPPPLPVSASGGSGDAAAEAEGEGAAAASGGAAAAASEERAHPRPHPQLGRQQPGQEVPPIDKYAPQARRLTAALLVGGATRMPLVRRYVAAVTGLEPRSELDPEAAVALGAALQAGALLGVAGAACPEIMDGSYAAALHDRATGFQSSAAQTAMEAAPAAAAPAV